MTTFDTGKKGPHPNARIENLRDAIDKIDNRLLTLINDRLKLAAEIGSLKQSAGNPVKDLEREARIISRLQRSNCGPIDNDLLTRVFVDIIRASCYLQNTIRSETEKNGHA